MQGGSALPLGRTGACVSQIRREEERVTRPFLPWTGGSAVPLTLGLEEGCVWEQAELRSQKADRGDAVGPLHRDLGEEGGSEVLGRERQEEVDAESKEGCHLELVSSPLLLQCPGVCFAIHRHAHTLPCICW